MAVRASVGVIARASRTRHAAAAPTCVRSMSSAPSDLEAFKAAWKAETKGYPVVEPKFEWTLEWVLPTPVPLHQFAESPVVVEVINRNPDGGHH